jgi:glycosidase
VDGKQTQTHASGSQITHDGVRALPMHAKKYQSTSDSDPIYWTRNPTLNGSLIALIFISKPYKDNLLGVQGIRSDTAIFYRRRYDIAYINIAHHYKKITSPAARLPEISFLRPTTYHLHSSSLALFSCLNGVDFLLSFVSNFIHNCAMFERGGLDVAERLDAHYHVCFTLHLMVRTKQTPS